MKVSRVAVFFFSGTRLIYNTVQHWNNMCSPDEMESFCRGYAPEQVIAGDMAMKFGGEHYFKWRTCSYFGSHTHGRISGPLVYFWVGPSLRNHKLYTWGLNWFSLRCVEPSNVRKIKRTNSIYRDGKGRGLGSGRGGVSGLGISEAGLHGAFGAGRSDRKSWNEVLRFARALPEEAHLQAFQAGWTGKSWD